MGIEASMSLLVAYYNSRLALWEPLIEPIEGIHRGKRISTPWELKTKVNFQVGIFLEAEILSFN